MNTDDRFRAAIGQLADAAPMAPSWDSVRDKLRRSSDGEARRSSLPPLPQGDACGSRVRLRTPKAAVAAVIAVGLLAVPAFGAVRQVASWLTGSKDRDAPIPLASDVVLASGVSGAGWEIVATPSTQGLCTFVRTEDGHGLGGCGPSDVRGDPAAGDNAAHWVQGGNGSGGLSRLNRSIVHGWAAPEVVSVELILMDGGSAGTQLLTTPEGLNGPPKLFWAALPCRFSPCADEDPLVRFLVARDAAGNVLETRDVHDPKATRSG